MQLSDFKGRLAVVTGASQGIGLATSQMLLEQGASVVGLSRTASSLAEHPNFTALTCDLAEADQVQQVIETIRQSHTSVDYLANIAGYDPKYTLEEGDLDHWDHLVNLNLRAYYLLIRGLLPLLKKGQGKSIINTSSINYRLGIIGRSIYSATKAGILGLTTGLARELGQDNIRINTITPGWTFTQRQIDEYFTEPDATRKHLAHLVKSQAIDRHITPLDIANHILFYLSEASAASTGHNCVVDGGWLLE